MSLPDYRGGSIVNLMSSIGKALGWKSKYNELKILPSSELRSKNTVLIVIDGLGYEWLVKHGKGSVFEKFLRGSMTSVFPATTATAITTFNTGVAPQQHALTGWFVHYKELGIVSVPLWNSPRIGGPSYSKYEIPTGELIGEKSFFDKIKAKGYSVIGQEIIDSDYTKATRGKGRRAGYKSLRGMFNTAAKIIRKPGKKFISAYWPKFDHLCHHHGTESRKVGRHFKELCRETERFIKAIKGTDSVVISTADHGLINSVNPVELKEHPKLAECLALPLSGDSRTAYCYVHPSKAREFEDYIKKNLSSKFELFKSEELVKKGYFGLGKPNPMLLQRIGDYTLIAKGNNRIKDTILGETPKKFIGHHSGLSKEEMLVPLIVVKD